MRFLQDIARRIAGSINFARSNSPASEADRIDSRPTAEIAELPFDPTDPDDAEYRVVASHIANLMLADEWIEIADDIAEWEDNLLSTTGGLRFHEIGVEVALSGLQSLIDKAAHASLSDLEETEYELGCFVETWRATPNHHILALLAARAHLTVGMACRADHWPSELRQDAWRQMAHHFVEAGDILANHNAHALMSPLVAEAQYMHAQGAPVGKQKVAALFDTWITLDPSNPRIYARHAEWLADPDNASQETLVALADIALARTEETLGLGGYALFFQPLLALSEDARTLYDPDIYATAILDLATHSATQADVNRAADTLAGEIDVYGPDAPLALKDTLLMLVRNEIKVCYPRLWSRPENAIRELMREAANTIPDVSFDDMPEAA